MTRINLVPVEELADQHLVAEYRELPRMNAALEKALRNRTLAELQRKIPAQFVLGTGHMMFFMDKGLFLKKRHALIVAEMAKRGIKVSYPLVNLDVFEWHSLMNDYTPTPEAIALSRTRIAERIAAKPTFYTWS